MHTAKKSFRTYEEKVRELGCIVTGFPFPHIHHVKGRTFKHSKVLIGPWFILPLHPNIHNGSHPHAYHNSKYGFIAEFGCPKDLFKQMLIRLDYELDYNVLNAIEDCYV